jgi:hypothetical protein
VLEVQVVQVDAGAAVPDGGDDHDTGLCSGGEVRAQQAGEFEVAEVAGAQLQFEAVRGAPQSRHADQDARRAVPRTRKGAHAGQVGEVEDASPDVRARMHPGYPLRRSSAGIAAANGEGYPGAGGGQGAGSLPAGT